MPPQRKVSSKQMDILIEFAKTHQHITMFRYGSVKGQEGAREAWDSVAVRLNAAGIKKTPAQWRRYWIEYKAKLKSKAADSRRGTEGQDGLLRPLSKQEQQLLDIINCVAAERIQPDPNVSDVKYSPNRQTSSPESEQTSFDVEWLDYESDDPLVDETDMSQSVKQHDDSEPVDILQSAEEDKITDSVREGWKNLRGSYKKHVENVSETVNSRKRRKLRGCRRFSETKQKNDRITSSSQKSTTVYEDLDKRPKKASLSDVTATALEYFNLKKNKSNETQDPDLLFFHSILPEMKQMTPDQKRQFKSGVWSLAIQILEQNKLESSSDHNYGLSQR